MTRPRPERESAVAMTSIAGLALVALSGFLPWVRVGRADHSSYRLSGELRRLGVGGVPGRVLHLWPLVPLAAAVAGSLVLIGWRRSGALAVAAVGGAGLAATVAAGRIPDRVLTGPAVALAGSLIAFVSAASMLVARRRLVKDRP